MAQLDKSELEKQRQNRSMWFALMSGIATGYVMLMGVYFLIL